MPSLKIDKNKIATAIVNTVVLIVESVVGLFFSLGASFSGQRESAPKFKIEGQHKTTVTVVLLLAITVSITSIFFTQCEISPPPINIKPDLGLGEVMAEETVQLMGRKGSIVIVSMDSGRFRMPLFEARLKAFKETLSSQSEITIAGAELLAPEPRNTIMPSSTFFTVLEKYPKVSGIVSFIGFPSLTEEETARLGPKSPKVVVFFQEHIQVEKFFDPRLIDVAVLPPITRSSATPRPLKTTRDWFDRYYTVVKPPPSDESPPP